MKKNFLIIMMLMLGVSALGFSKKIDNKRVQYKKVCVQKNKRTGKCLRYENRRVNNTPPKGNPHNNYPKR